MKGSMRVALALGVGYLLGRSKTVRRGAGKLVPGDLVKKLVPGELLTGELGTLVGELVETVRGDLLDAARSAATAAVTSRLDSFSGTLHDRAETFRNPEAAAARAGEAAGKAGQTAGRAGGAAGRLRRRGRAPEGEDDTGRAGYDEEQEGGADERGDGRSRRDRPGTRRARDEAEEPGEPEDEYEDEDSQEEEPDQDEVAEAPAGEFDDEEEETEEPAPRRARASRSPVSRRRR